ncbi:hypothetical protein ACP70R_015721 [Stipagrostis hirtigluma subsp. patula]
MLLGRHRRSGRGTSRRPRPFPGSPWKLPSAPSSTASCSTELACDNDQVEAEVPSTMPLQPCSCCCSRGGGGEGASICGAVHAAGPAVEEKVEEVVADKAE